MKQNITYDKIGNAISQIIDNFSKEKKTIKPLLTINNNGKTHKEIIQLISEIGLYGPRVDGKNYLAQLFSGKEDIALIADMAASLFNAPMHTTKSSGIHLDVEKEVITHIASMIRYQDGIMSPGGSLSNLTAMIIARYKKSNTKNTGIHTKYRIYTSTQAHYSIIKNAGITGIGRENVMFIPSNEGKMDVSLLEEAIAKDLLDNHTPLMIISTSGTTNFGEFENLPGIINIAKKYDLWHHVDGAFGGSLLFSNTHKKLLSGIEECDSLTLDAHKLFSVPITSSLLLTKRDDVLSLLSEEAEYLFSERTENDAGHKSIQCARRNDALKVWATLQQGTEYLSNLIDQKIIIAKYASELIKKSTQLKLYCTPQLPLICIHSTKKDVYKILSDKGNICSQITLKGKKWVRLSLINKEFQKEDIDKLLADLL